MRKIRVSAVSYTNTKPFVYGLQHSDIINDIELSLDIPSDCAQKLIDNEADLGLIPVAAILKIPGYQIVSNYCIGANGAVDSVFLFSEKPIDQINSIRYDRQSRTSNSLTKVLVDRHWKRDIEFVTEGDADAFVEIGDRTFGKKNTFKYVYDLAAEWKKMTGLPFVFAAWVSNKKLQQDFVDRFNSALKIGLNNIDVVVSQLPVQQDFDVQNYLCNSLNFDLDADKRKALSLFLKYLSGSAD